ncbi:hypothetical protein DFJ74DRAFT_689676 [Hyaloraphidium curvatum]|nr:hypothetical protein DFJ74DRAFT_689676 [Hyaloraphidium curvatum]
MASPQLPTPSPPVRADPPFPAISLAALTDPSRRPTAAELQKLGDDIVRACHETGFLYLSDIGIEDGKVDAMWALSRAFFEGIPEEESKKYKQDLNQLGYKAFEDQPNHKALAGVESDAQKMYGKMHLNLPGKYGIGNHDSNPDRRWPPLIVENERLLDSFSRDCNTLAKRIMSLIAIGLRIPDAKGGASFFDDMHNYEAPSGCTLRLLYYPPLPKEFGTAEEGYTRIGAHCDIGTVTLLFQESIGGLYVKNRRGGWDLAPPRKGSIIVNLGEELQVMSGGYLRATPHKVVATSSRESTTPRLSIAYFTYPRFDTVLKPFPKGTSPVLDSWDGKDAGEDINWNGLGTDGKDVNAMELLTDKYARIYGFPEKWTPEIIGRGKYATGEIGRRAAQAEVSGRL